MQIQIPNPLPPLHRQAKRDGFKRCGKQLSTHQIPVVEPLPGETPHRRRRRRLLGEHDESLTPPSIMLLRDDVDAAWSEVSAGHKEGQEAPSGPVG
jgi:hypothetical protein